MASVIRLLGKYNLFARTGTAPGTELPRIEPEVPEMRPPGPVESGASAGESAAEPAPARLVLDLGAGAQGWLQPLADLELWCDRPLLPGARPAPRPERAPAPPAAADRGHLIYDGPGIVAGGQERVRAWLDGAGVRTVEFPDGERFRVSSAGDRIEALVSAALPASASACDRRLELGLGGPLALALALHGVHLLHASALVIGGVVVAFTGASGTGKSTLAAAGRSRRGWRRAADDILATRLGEAPRALLAFPQLKLPLDEGWPADEAAALPLAAMIEIEHRGTHVPARIEERSGAAAVKCLVGATVAARLFDPTLLAGHLDRAATSVARLRIGRLSYPSGLAGLEMALDGVREWVAQVTALEGVP